MKKICFAFIVQVACMCLVVTIAHAEPDPEEAPPKVTHAEIQQKMRS